MKRGPGGIKKTEESFTNFRNKNDYYYFFVCFFTTNMITMKMNEHIINRNETRRPEMARKKIYIENEKMNIF